MGSKTSKSSFLTGPGHDDQDLVSQKDALHNLDKNERKIRWIILDDNLKQPVKSDVQPFPDILAFKAIVYSFKNTDGRPCMCSAVLWMQIETHRNVIKFSEEDASVVRPPQLRPNVKYRTRSVFVLGVQFVDAVDVVYEAAYSLQSNPGKLLSIHDHTFEYRLNERVTESKFQADSEIVTDCGVGIHFFVNLESATKYTNVEGYPVITRVFRSDDVARDTLLVSVPKNVDSVFVEKKDANANHVGTVHDDTIVCTNSPVFNSEHRVEKISRILRYTKKSDRPVPVSENDQRILRERISARFGHDNRQSGGDSGFTAAGGQGGQV